MKEFPPFRVDPGDQCLWRGGERIALTPKAFSVLQYLVEHAGRLVTQSELLEALWQGTFVQPEVLKSHVLEIRKALDDDARSPRFIETQPRRGYRFIAAVRDGTASGAPERKPAPAASIAVLPFADLSGDTANEYFGDGLAEEVINTLARIPGLKVIARTSACAFKGQNQDIRRIAETLGVAHVLEGSVRRAGNQVRVAAQLIAASDGSPLWSGRYDREMTDVFAIQDEIAQALADALQSSLGSPLQRPPEMRSPACPEAYQAYLEGRHYMQQVTAEGMEHARECYQRAIRLDPRYAAPHVGLADMVYYEATYLSRRPRELAPAALTSLVHALQLEPNSAYAHLIRGMFFAFYEYNWKAAEDHYSRALELDPASARVRTNRCLWFLLPLGRWDEALSEARLAVSLDPLNPAVRNPEAFVYHVMRKEEAIECARTANHLFPSRWLSSWIAGLVCLRNQLTEEATAVVEKSLQIAPSTPYLLGVLALVRARQGRLDEAKAIRNQMEEHAARQYVPFFPRAHASEACGDMEMAYRLWDQAVDEREPVALAVLADRRADLLPDPRYQRLLRKMNLA